MPAHRAIYVAPFDELSEPRLVAELATRAERAGWDGFFVWDHLTYRAPVEAVADPWVTLAAVATATRRLALGPMITPLPRRRPHKLARETVTLDRLSGGRLVLGVGIGSERSGEFDRDRFGEEDDPRTRGRLLDEGLERLQAYWDGEFRPRPVERIPVWVAATWPNRRPLRRTNRPSRPRRWLLWAAGRCSSPPRMRKSCAMRPWPRPAAPAPRSWWPMRW